MRIWGYMRDWKGTAAAAGKTINSADRSPGPISSEWRATDITFAILHKSVTVRRNVYQESFIYKVKYEERSENGRKLLYDSFWVLQIVTR